MQWGDILKITEEHIIKLEDRLGDKIDSYLKTEKAADLESAERITYILSKLKLMQQAESQLAIMENMKEVDFSKLDINSMLQGLMKGDV